MKPFPLARRLAMAILITSALAACNSTEKAAGPREIASDTACSLDGMVLADYPGPKAQIHYAQGEPDFFCDTVEMFSIYLRPEQKRGITGVFVQDMGKADWATPKGHWIDARSAFYVVGSRREGSMGPTIASFSSENDAQRFAAEYGGKVLPFASVTPDMATLDGGIIHDQRM
jgi:copper chaperone NosL